MHTRPHSQRAPTLRKSPGHPGHPESPHLFAAETPSHAWSTRPRRSPPGEIGGTHWGCWWGPRGRPGPLSKASKCRPGRLRPAGPCAPSCTPGPPSPVPGMGASRAPQREHPSTLPAPCPQEGGVPHPQGALRHARLPRAPAGLRAAGALQRLRRGPHPAAGGRVPLPEGWVSGGAGPGVQERSGARRSLSAPTPPCRAHRLPAATRGRPAVRPRLPGQPGLPRVPVHPVHPPCLVAHALTRAVSTSQEPRPRHQAPPRPRPLSRTHQSPVGHSVAPPTTGVKPLPKPRPPQRPHPFSGHAQSHAHRHDCTNSHARCSMAPPTNEPPLVEPTSRPRPPQRPHPLFSSRPSQKTTPTTTPIRATAPIAVQGATGPRPRKIPWVEPTQQPRPHKDHTRF